MDETYRPTGKAENANAEMMNELDDFENRMQGTGTKTKTKSVHVERAPLKGELGWNM